ncbi:DMT family transporter [Paenirhodobacter populi]|uniref:DMT family transporter n=1 Tax=Paenirhodobacter populi TaxID=2306993 RepID=A0A443JNU1_9RHOB|nr:DMT family transporter [Sinirhodobacter populi]RWR22170.1 DMT family transporter [Sinirhodobacter populi]
MPAAEFVPSSSIKGITLKLTSVVLFVAMSAMLKATADTVPPGELVFFRSFFGIIPILGWLVIVHGLHGGLAVKQPGSHILRGIIGTTAMALNFAALAFLPLPEATAIGYAAPILTVVFAALFLGERVRIVRISAVVIGMTGVLIVLWPQLGGHVGETMGTSNETFGAMLALIGAGFSALAAVQIRRMVNFERPTAIAFWFACTASALSLFTLPFGWVMPTPEQAVLLIGAGLLGGAAQILMTTGYRYADASLLAPIDYASILFALVIGYYIFGEVPAATTLLGAAVVIAAGVLIIFRERQLGIERRKQRKASTPQG